MRPRRPASFVVAATRVRTYGNPPINIIFGTRRRQGAPRRPSHRLRRGHGPRGAQARCGKACQKTARGASDKGGKGVYILA
jgi:hypothetical protein